MIFYICGPNQNHVKVKKTILIAVLCCLVAGFASANSSHETVRSDKVYVSLAGGTQINLNLRFIDAGGQLELGWWFSPYTAVAINAGGNLVIGRNSAGADEIFAGKDFDLQARLLGLLELTNLFLGEEEGARTDFHIAGYAGLGKIVNEVPAAGTAYYWLPSIGIDLSDRISSHLSIYGRAGVNLYHPLRNLTIYPEASIGLRVGLGKGRTYEKDPYQSYKDDIAALEQELEKEKQNVKVKTDTVVITETQEVEKIIRDTVVLTVNQVDTLTIYDVVEVGAGVAPKVDTVYVKADTVYIKSLPEVLVKTVYPADEEAQAVDSVAAAPLIQVDTVYVVTMPEPEVLVQVQTDTVYVPAAAEVLVQVQTDTVFVQSEPEVLVQVQKDTVFVPSLPEIQIQFQVQKDTVYVPSEPEIMVRTVYVNKEPIVLRDTVFVATDPEVQIQTVYRDKEPVILVDTVYVQSEPEIEVRTVYRDREVVKIQKDTVLVELEPEVQVKVVTDTVFVQSEPEVQIEVQVQTDTVYVPSDPEIMVRTVYVNKEPIVLRDTVFVATDPEVQIQTIYRDKEPVILVDTVYVQSEPEIEIRYREREVVKVHVQKDTIFIPGPTQVDTVIIEKDPIIQIDTVVIEKDPIVQFDTIVVEKAVAAQIDTVVIEKDPIVQIDTVVIEKDPIVQIDTVIVEKDPIVQIDTVVIEKDPVVQIDTVVIEKDPIVQIDTVVVEQDPIVQIDTVIVPMPIEPESSMITVVFPENAAWVNYGARKQLDKLAKEITESDSKYLLIAPISPDSEDAVKAYNLGVRRVSQVRLHLIRENGVDSRKLRETVLVSPAGIPVEDGNGFVIVAREDDPRVSELLGQ